MFFPFPVADKTCRAACDNFNWYTVWRHITWHDKHDSTLTVDNHFHRSVHFSKVISTTNVGRRSRDCDWLKWQHRSTTYQIHTHAQMHTYIRTSYTPDYVYDEMLIIYYRPLRYSSTSESTKLRRNTYKCRCQKCIGGW